MKNYRILINIFLVIAFIFAFMSFVLMIKLCDACYSNYKILSDFYSDTQDALSMFLQTLFATLFSALGAIASAVIAVIYNLPALKAKKLSDTEKPKED